jgi:hypothetical protein
MDKSTYQNIASLYLYPTISIQNFNIREGQPVTLRCQVIGIPQPMISWQKDGRMLVPNKPYR